MEEERETFLDEAAFIAALSRSAASLLLPPALLEFSSLYTLTGTFKLDMTHLRLEVLLTLLLTKQGGYSKPVWPAQACHAAQVLCLAAHSHWGWARRVNSKLAKLLICEDES